MYLDAVHPGLVSREAHERRRKLAQERANEAKAIAEAEAAEVATNASQTANITD